MGEVFVGIDAGAWKKDRTCTCWTARLKDHRFEFGKLPFKRGNLLLRCLSEPGVAAVAVDAPQGLPALGFSRRRADCEADTPTRVLPTKRSQLRPGSRQPNGKQYPFLGLVRFGCELFWANRRYVSGLKGRRPKLVETYPRAILARWVEKKTIPSKKKRPTDYVDFVKSLLKKRGYSWEGDIQRLDHCDAMLCAVAAELHFQDKADYVGRSHNVDRTARIIREGLIVLPKHRLFSR